MKVYMLKHPEKDLYYSRYKTTWTTQKHASIWITIHGVTGAQNSTRKRLRDTGIIETFTLEKTND